VGEEGHNGERLATSSDIDPLRRLGNHRFDGTCLGTRLEFFDTALRTGRLRHKGIAVTVQAMLTIRAKMEI